MIFGIRKLESWGYRVAYLHDPIFSRFDTIPECYRHTQTDRHTMTAYTALSIASRGKDLQQHFAFEVLAYPCYPKNRTLTGVLRTTL